jgi:glycosyltransferase involved in cell wall biosynthesis
VNVGSAMRHLPRAIIKTIKMCRTAKLDFIVCCVDDFSLILGWVASLCSGRPYWVVAEDPPFTGRYAQNPGFWRRLEGRLRSWLLRRLIEKSKGLFCFIEQQALDDFLPAVTHVIPLKIGVSDEARDRSFSLRSKLLTRSGPSLYTIGYVGAINPEQGILELLEAIRIAHRSVSDVRVLLIGDVDPDWRREFTEAIEKFDLKGRAEVTGWLPYDDMLRRLANCDVCCYVRRSSLWSKSAYPLKICEYLGSARSIISWDYPGCRALLGDGRFGLLVPPGNINALAKALVRFCEPELRNAFGAEILDNMDELSAGKGYEELLATCSQAP